jgi:CP family cyanate transporter-like MFS transporter
MNAEPHQEPTAGDATAPERRRTERAALLAAGIILISISLRAPFTGVGPLLGAIRADLGLSASAAGFLTSLPLLGFGLVSTIAPPIARRLGMEVTLFAVLLLMAAGFVVRWLPPAFTLFLGTAMLAAAVAVGNVMMPSLVKREFPRRIGLMTSIYVTVMSFCGAFAAGIAVPVAGVVPGGWRTALAIWIVPVAIATAVWSVQLGHNKLPPPLPPGTMRLRLWRSMLAWKVTIYMGLQSLTFYIILSWLPTILQPRGFSAADSGWLLFLTQGLSSLCGMMVPLLLHRGFDQRRLTVLFTLACFVCFAGLTVAPGLAVLWVLVLAPGTGGCFVLALAFISLRAGGVREAVALSGMAQGLGYLIASAGPVAFGFLHDLTGSWMPAMFFLLAMTVLQGVFGYAAGEDAEIRASR